MSQIRKIDKGVAVALVLVDPAVPLLLEGVDRVFLVPFEEDGEAAHRKVVRVLDVVGELQEVVTEGHVKADAGHVAPEVAFEGVVAAPVGGDVREKSDVAIGDVVELVAVLAVAVLAADPEVVEVGRVVLGVGIGPRVDPAFLHLGAGPDVFLVPGAVGSAADEVAVVDAVEGSRLLDAFVGVAHDLGIVAIGDAGHRRDEGGKVVLELGIAFLEVDAGIVLVGALLFVIGGRDPVFARHGRDEFLVLADQVEVEAIRDEEAKRDGIEVDGFGIGAQGKGEAGRYFLEAVGRILDHRRIPGNVFLVEVRAGFHLVMGPDRRLEGQGIAEELHPAREGRLHGPRRLLRILVGTDLDAVARLPEKAEGIEVPSKAVDEIGRPGLRFVADAVEVALIRLVVIGLNLAFAEVSAGRRAFGRGRRLRGFARGNGFAFRRRAFGTRGRRRFLLRLG